jgi:hypothetical protein
LALAGRVLGGWPVFGRRPAAAAARFRGFGWRQRTGAALQASTTLQPLPRGDAARQLPIVLQAQKITGQPDQTQSRG